jgi:hypothetical protein
MSYLVQMDSKLHFASLGIKAVSESVTARFCRFNLRDSLLLQNYSQNSNGRYKRIPFPPLPIILFPFTINILLDPNGPQATAFNTDPQAHLSPRAFYYSARSRFDTQAELILPPHNSTTLQLYKLSPTTYYTTSKDLFLQHVPEVRPDLQQRLPLSRGKDK